MSINEELEAIEIKAVDGVAIDAFVEVDAEGAAVRVNGGRAGDGWSLDVVVDGGFVVDDLSEGLDVVVVCIA